MTGRPDLDDFILLQLRVERLEKGLQKTGDYNLLSIVLRGAVVLLVLLGGLYALLAGLPIPDASWDVALIIILTFLGADGAIRLYRHRDKDSF